VVGPRILDVVADCRAGRSRRFGGTHSGCGSVSRSAAFWSGCIRSLTVSVVFVDWSGGPDGSWGPRRVGGQFHCGHGLGRQRHGALLGRGH